MAGAWSLLGVVRLMCSLNTPRFTSAFLQLYTGFLRCLGVGARSPVSVGQVTVPCWAGLGLQTGADHTSLVCDLLDLCSLHSWCPEAEGAFHLGVAGLYPFLGALEKQLAHTSGRWVVCIWVKAVLAVGTTQRNTLELEAWAHPEGKYPRACTAGLSDGLSRLGMSLEELENGFLGWGPAGISVVICVRFSRHSKPCSCAALGAGTANSWLPWEQHRACHRPGTASAPAEPKPTTHPLYSPFPHHPPHHPPGSQQQLCQHCPGSPGLKAAGPDFSRCWERMECLPGTLLVPSSVPALLAQSVGPDPSCSGACPPWMPLTHLHVLSGGPILFP